MINAFGEHQCTVISSYSHCRCVAVSLPAVKLVAIKYGVLTSGLRYTSLSAREMRDPGRSCDDLVTLSRTGDLASVHSVTLVLSADIYFVWWSAHFFTAHIRSTDPWFLADPDVPSSWDARRVNLWDTQKFSCGWATS